MTDEPILTLPAVPIDIVGDVHGHLQPLRALVHLLGYDDEGRHPRGGGWSSSATCAIAGRTAPASSAG